MKLRLCGPDGTVHQISLPAMSTWGELENLIEAKTGIPALNQVVTLAHSPARIDSSITASIRDVGIKHRDVHHTRSFASCVVGVLCCSRCSRCLLRKPAIEQQTKVQYKETTAQMQRPP